MEVFSLLIAASGQNPARASRFLLTGGEEKGSDC